MFAGAISSAADYVVEGLVDGKEITGEGVSSRVIVGMTVGAVTSVVGTRIIAEGLGNYIDREMRSELENAGISLLNQVFVSPEVALIAKPFSNAMDRWWEYNGE
jgi:hypothetical protein